MGNRVLTLLTAAISVGVAIFASLLSIALAQSGNIGPSFRNWLIGLAAGLLVLLLCLLVSAVAEVITWARVRKLAALLAREETLNEVGLRIPRDDWSRVALFWGSYQAWASAVLTALNSANDRADFETVDRGNAPDGSRPLTDAQVFEVAGRVAVLRTIVRRLGGT
jgi:hypothetical protein